MERFIVTEFYLTVKKKLKFKIQYGEIYSSSQLDSPIMQPLI